MMALGAYVHWWIHIPYYIHAQTYMYIFGDVTHAGWGAIRWRKPCWWSGWSSFWCEGGNIVSYRVTMSLLKKHGLICKANIYKFSIRILMFFPLLCMEERDGAGLAEDSYQTMVPASPCGAAGLSKLARHEAPEPPATPIRRAPSLLPGQQTPTPTTPASNTSSNPDSKQVPSPQQAVEVITRAAAKKRLSRLFAPRVDGTYAVDPEVAKLWADTKQQTALIDEFISLGYCKVLRV